MNYAARVSAVALPGQILVSAVVADVLRQAGDVKLGQGRQVQLKGLPGPQMVFDIRD